MAQKNKYTVDELVEIYRHYAQLKGWSTNEQSVRDRVTAWIERSIGPVGLAIEFQESGTDGAKHLGYDAHERSVSSPIQRLMVTLAGTEHANSDGTKRRDIAAQCVDFDPLYLRHEPNNKFDPNAIGVFRTNHQQLGYLPRRIAGETVARMKQGFRHAAVIDAVKPSTRFVTVSGSGSQSNPYDVLIAVFVIEPCVSNEVWENHYQAWVMARRQAAVQLH